MAIDSRKKRASVPGVGRPFMRGKFPGTIDEGWRHGSANSYAGTVLSPPAGGFEPAFAINVNTLLGGGLNV